jgi:hypothetical protein
MHLEGSSRRPITQIGTFDTLRVSGERPELQQELLE